MPREFPSVEAARDYAFFDQRALIRSLKNPVGYRQSYWQGKSLGAYIYGRDGTFWLSSRYPVDLLHGTLVNPSAQLFSGASVTLAPAALRDVVGIAITLVGGWLDAEVNYRLLFSSWSQRLRAPIYVQLALENHPWHRKFWTHSAQECVAVDRKAGDMLCEIAR